MWVSHLVVSWALPVCYDEIKSEMVPVDIERLRKEPVCLWLRSVRYLPAVRPASQHPGLAGGSSLPCVLCRCTPVNEWHRLGSFGLLGTSSSNFTAPVTVSVSYLFLFTPPLLLPWVAAVALLCINVLQRLLQLWVNCSQGSCASLSEASISNWLSYLGWTPWVFFLPPILLIWRRI